MRIHVPDSPFPISPELVAVVRRAVATYEGVVDNGLAVHFKDPGYSAETGGFHPVEVGVGATGQLHYITDFAYVGRQPQVELVKSLDFDFQQGVFQQAGREWPLRDGASIYRLWERNFLAYYELGVYRVSVTAL